MPPCKPSRLPYTLLVITFPLSLLTCHVHGCACHSRRSRCLSCPAVLQQAPGRPCAYLARRCQGKPWPFQRVWPTLSLRRSFASSLAKPARDEGAETLEDHDTTGKQEELTHFFLIKPTRAYTHVNTHRRTLPGTSWRRRHPRLACPQRTWPSPVRRLRVSPNATPASSRGAPVQRLPAAPPKRKRRMVACSERRDSPRSGSSSSGTR